MEKQIYTTKDFAQGKVGIEYGGGLERLIAVLRDAFPAVRIGTLSAKKYYIFDGDRSWRGFDKIQSNSQVKRYISEEEILLAEEYKEMVLQSIATSNKENPTLVVEKQIEKRLPHVTVFQNGIRIIDSMHFSQQKIKKDSDDNIIGTFYANEAENIFVPVSCVTNEVHPELENKSIM